MYVLEGTGPLLRAYHMKPGDALVIARSQDSGLIVGGKKGEPQASGPLI
jgi:hypothetical protein